jgi:peptidoglycan/LPS O-acetylase OafA/YrhL
MAMTIGKWWTIRAGNIPTTVVVWAGSVLLAWSAVIHYHLWLSEGYRNIPTIGPLFLAQAIVAAASALLTAVTRRFVPALASAGLLVASIAALLVSSWWGLFGWQESLGAPYVGLALAVEGAGAVLLAASCLAMALPVASRLSSGHRSGPLAA